MTSLPGTLGLYEPGDGDREDQEHDLAPVTQETNVGVVPAGVGVVHGLGHGAPAHPDEGLDHPQEASEQQDVPAHRAVSELTGHQLLTVIV